MTERVVLVTGSTSGIGLATARRFAERGDTVVFNSAHSVEAGEHLASITYESRYVQGDIANATDCQRLVATVLEHFGRLDVLVNNAGTTKVIPHHDLEAASVDVWREIFEVNVFGTWQLSVEAMEALRDEPRIDRQRLVGCRSSRYRLVDSLRRLEGRAQPYDDAARQDRRARSARERRRTGLIDTPWTQDWTSVRSYVQGVAPLRRTRNPR